MSISYASWNRLPRLRPQAISVLTEPTLPASPLLPLTIQGNARSYGDVCLTAHGTLVSTRRLNNFISFDNLNGILRCFSGTTLAEILALIVPQGWFLPTTPGTALITIGGAVANDVHGKNHHTAGTFGHHILKMELLRSNGEHILLSPHSNKELFYATIGGLGLTGLITWVEIQLIRIHNPMVSTESHSFYSLDEYWQLNQEKELHWPYSASWIDCLSEGRGIMFLGKHAAALESPFPKTKAKFEFPFELPFSLVNNLTVRTFNNFYFYKNRRSHAAIIDYKPFFYPLDEVLNWNRIYGHRGFYQYQCLFPSCSEQIGIKSLLNAIKSSKQGSFLAVLKSFGDITSRGMLSFPRQGTTLALDFPNKGRCVHRLLKRLDSIVSEHYGILYPGKDARMSGKLFRDQYPQWEEFSKFIDPKFSSHFWERVTR